VLNDIDAKPGRDGVSVSPSGCAVSVVLIDKQAPRFPKRQGHGEAVEGLGADVDAANQIARNPPSKVGHDSGRQAQRTAALHELVSVEAKGRVVDTLDHREQQPNEDKSPKHRSEGPRLGHRRDESEPQNGAHCRHGAHAAGAGEATLEGVDPREVGDGEARGPLL
jgi:hypothetical protein